MSAATNIARYPWMKACQNLLFWQATWFLYFQGALSGAEAILLYVVFDLATTALEVPSGWMSDRLGRRRTLLAAALSGGAGAALLALGTGFAAFALGQALLGASMAFSSGTDSALLYESLALEGRESEVERHELRAWRAGFAALALSAVTGGLMARAAPALPFAANALAFAAMAALVLAMSEPRHRSAGAEIPTARRAGATLAAALRQPALRWLFALAVTMYAFSHVPFVFGQPVIAEALETRGLATEAPLVSGLVTATMMALSVAVSLAAPRLRRRIGLAAMLLTAFALQVALIGALALTGSALAIALLFLRMVPDALSRPYILARVQPLLASESRATYLSLQSLAGRLAFALSLLLAAGSARAVGEMPRAELAGILGAYAGAGLLILAALALALRRSGIETAAPGTAR